MKQTLRCLILMILTGFGYQASAQSTGIAGTVTDNEGLPALSASVTIYSGGINKGGNVTDIDGNYSITAIEPGRYDVHFSYLGKEVIITDVIVVANEQSTVNAKIENKTQLTGTTVHGSKYVPPLINPKSPGNQTTMTKEQIDHLPTVTTIGAVKQTAGVYSNGNGIVGAGARASGTKYIVDGVDLGPGNSTFTNLPPGSVDAITTITGGLPAKYGDASGLVISIVTRGVTAKTRANLWLEQSIDGYNNTQASFGLSGPLLKVGDSANRHPVLGYSINGSVQNNVDASPTYDKNYVIKPDVMSNLEAHPLTVIPSNSGGSSILGNSAEFLTLNDMDQQKQRQNAGQFTMRLNGKIDYQLAPDINLTVGGFYGHNKFQNGGGLLNPNGFTESTYNTTRGYLRFRQRFAKGNGADSSNAISNAAYTIQADYQRDTRISQDPDHKENPFAYGYVGKFTQRLREVYAPDFVDTVTGTTGFARFYIFDGVDFQRSELNPLLANYTTEYFNLTPYQPNSLNEISANGGVLNGGGPTSVYSLFSNVGSGPSGFNKAQEEQVAVSADASFDYKYGRTLHSFEVGLYYQQRTERGYGISGAGLWGLMRQLANGNYSQDLSNPHFLVNGTIYDTADVNHNIIHPGVGDTILYTSTLIPGTFATNVRNALGIQYGDYVQIDAQDPDFYSLGMFSADELLNGGSSLISYYGYDYMGNLQTGTVNFDDFFKKKDANGNYTRPIAAFRPNYIAGYISDYIQYKTFRLTLGLRAERFDMNTKVLKDPYSLYASHTVADQGGAINHINNGVTPSNIGSNYVVYVADNNSANPSIIGYRNGDDWYDARGNYIEDPSVLKDAANGGVGTNAQPYLQDSLRITSASYDPQSSFTDYKPQVNVMPRINFSFPISDVALFYAHYDVVVQRPVTGYTATPIDYYFFTQRSNGTLGNPDLKPEKLIDYEVGFQQRLSDFSAVTLSLFYRERRDQIAIRPYLNAYPIDYYTFGNRDFSTTKGLTVKYELRNAPGSHLGLNLAYTLQMAEGTGSNEFSASRGGLLQNFISERVPNMRTVFPLDIDSRHILSVNADYRYGQGEGPKVGDHYIFQNTGLNFVFSARSGEPYTRYAEAQTVLGGVNQNQRIQGGVNGSRLPWHYGLDLRLDRDFVINFNKKNTVSAYDRRQSGGLSFNVYLRIENVLNTRDVAGVYGYTGSSVDDGYLTSAQGAATISSQTNPESFVQYYNIAMRNPGFYGAPRRMNIGLQVNF